jgi:nascent polypeptide-associated complex subunit beta
MNPAKLKKLEASVRTGGKGSVRRKRKAVHRSGNAGNQKLQVAFQRLGLQQLDAIDEVNMFKEDGTVLNFQQPTTSANVQSRTFVVQGTPQQKTVQELLPGILTQMGPEGIQSLQSAMGAASAAEGADGDDDDVPDLVESFDENKE